MVIKVFKILCFIALAFSVQLSAQTDPDKLDAFDYSANQSFEIGGVKVTGAESRDRNAIKSIAGLKVGKTIKIPGDDIPKAVKALWKLKLFEDVQIIQEKLEDNIIFLEILLIERPTLSRYSYKGEKKTRHEELNDILERILNKGSIVTDDVKDLSRIKLEEYYVEKGYLDAKVKIKEFPDRTKDNSVRLEFNIDKGDKVRIQNLDFNGNIAISDKKLRKKMKETKRRRAFFKKSKYIEEDYEVDKNAIVHYYNTKGYRNAKIQKDSVWRNEKGNLNMLLDITEGDQFFFRDITWKGNSKYTTEQLSNVLGIFKGDVYNPELLEKRLSFSQDGRDVSSLYLDDGYLFFTVDPIEAAIIGDSIDLEMEIFEGPQATINDVVIKGNDRTHEHVVRRVLRTKPGNKFSRSDIIRSQREIMNLGYFNPESMNIQTPVNQQQGTVDIIYELEEQPSDQLELSAGYGGASGLIGTLGLTFNNFSLRNMKNKAAWSPLPQGDGQKVSVRFQSNSRFFRSYNMTFTEPWLGGKKPNSLTVGAVRSDFDLSTIGSGSLFITRLFVGLGTQLKWPDDFFSSSTTFTTEWINLKDYQTRDFFVENQPISTGRFKNISLRQVISRSSIAEPIYPKRGSRISLSLQFTPPYSLFRSDNFFEVDDTERGELIADRNFVLGSGNQMTTAQEEAYIEEVELIRKHELLEYHKWRFDAEWYYSLVGNLVLAANVKMGFLGAYNSELGISPFERFELGGDGLSNQSAGITGKDIIALRGYEVSDVTNNLGGSALFDKFTMELRYPLSTNPSSTIYMHTFVQGGNAWNRFKDYNPFDLRRSAGFGLRVFLPMFGLLGFDYGWGFDKNSNFGKFSIVLGFEPD